jgi:hypothetical protein
MSLAIVPQAGSCSILIAQRLNLVSSRFLLEYQEAIEYAALPWSSPTHLSTMIMKNRVCQASDQRIPKCVAFAVPENKSNVVLSIPSFRYNEARQKSYSFGRVVFLRVAATKYGRGTLDRRRENGANRTGVCDGVRTSFHSFNRSIRARTKSRPLSVPPIAVVHHPSTRRRMVRPQPDLMTTANVGSGARWR